VVVHDQLTDLRRRCPPSVRANSLSVASDIAGEYGSRSMSGVITVDCETAPSIAVSRSRSVCAWMSICCTINHEDKPNIYKYENNVMKREILKKRALR